MAEIELSQMIIDLRAALERAQAEGEGKSVQFLVNETELELDVKVAGDAEAGVKFYILSAGAKASDEHTQKIRLKLQPVTKVGKKYRKLTIADEGKR